MYTRKILTKFLHSYQRFMQGRYGSDTLNLALIIFGFLFSGIMSLVRVRSYPVYFIVKTITLLPYIAVVYRSLSKNITARQSENAAFLRFIDPIKQRIARKINQARDTQHRYYTCPGCRATLRVPSGRGKINITCPHCSRQFKRNTGKRS